MSMSNVLELKPKEKKEMVQKDQQKLPRNWYVWAIAMAGLSSFLFLVIFWFTNIFQDFVLSNLPIQNGTTSFEYWQRVPVRLTYKIYIFNYTNVEDFESGKASKLKVQELGPYIYRETMKRVNVQIHENDTVSFQLDKSFQWEGGSPDDEIVVVPNVPLFAAVSYSRNWHFVAKLVLNTGLSALKLKPFVNVTAAGFLWGYDDRLFQILKTLSSFKTPIPFDEFGILASSTGVMRDRFTMYTGINDLNKLGIIERINGEDHQNVWGDEKCNKIHGTDGSMFPPSWVRNDSTPLHVYVKELCRTLAFRYHGYSEAHGIPSLRYKMDPNSFNTSSLDFCFCPKMAADSPERKCPPNGIFNSSACVKNAPMLFSFPHFYAADRSIQESIEGLKPDKNLHESYLELHQRLGITIGGSSKMQLNMEVRKAAGVPHTGKLADGTILPLIWCDTTITDLPRNVYNILYDAHYLTAIVEGTFRWGSILVLVASISFFSFTLRKQQMQRRVSQRRNALS